MDTRLVIVTTSCTEVYLVTFVLQQQQLSSYHKSRIFRI